MCPGLPSADPECRHATLCSQASPSTHAQSHPRPPGQVQSLSRRWTQSPAGHGIAQLRWAILTTCPAGLALGRVRLGAARSAGRAAGLALRAAAKAAPPKGAGKRGLGGQPRPKPCGRVPAYGLRTRGSGSGCPAPSLPTGRPQTRAKHAQRLYFAPRRPAGKRGGCVAN